MPVFNVVKTRVDWADLLVEADTYEEAMQLAEDMPIEPNQVEYGKWETDIQLGGRVD